MPFFVDQTFDAMGYIPRQRLQDLETALQGSNITVSVQDCDLRYTWVAGRAYGLMPEEVVGRTDEDILPAESRNAIISLKRGVIDSGRPYDSEVSIPGGSRTRRYDVHIEPQRDATGAVVGVICALTDVTERKEGEAHLRLLLRELTHRSKNLLAVIQAMARQTARHVGSIDAFLDQFSARLQALATSHDLLVQQSWYGASLAELVRSHLGHYLDGKASQVVLEGPGVVLKPEAAQSLGLALHELATNAAKYGALSSPAGRVTIQWRALGDRGVEIVWDEAGGPKVRAPERRGFGSLVVERNLARSLDGEVDLTFPPTGVHCRIVIPRGQLSVGR